MLLDADSGWLTEEEGRFDRDDLDEILLTGGCSRIPHIEQRLKAEFGTAVRKLEPEAVVVGAAIKARQLASTVNQRSET
jgi:molecular chaperone DnaK (HSP70)